MSSESIEPQGQGGDVLPFSFPGRELCKVCGAPVPPKYLTPKGICQMCAQNIEYDQRATELMTGKPISGFDAVLNDVKRKGRPLSVDLTDSLMDRLGGPEGLAARIVDDLRALRGEDLGEEVKAFHVPDFKTIKGIYEIIARVMKGRDEIVGDHGDPFDGVDPEDVMAVAAQAAVVQVAENEAFAREMVQALLDSHPALIAEVAYKALERLSTGPRVEIVDG